jgi:nucleotide-binding universal stress UspA family protein
VTAFCKVLVAVRLDRPSGALDAGARFASAVGAELVVVHVCEPPVDDAAAFAVDLLTPAVELAARRLGEAVAAARARVPAATGVLRVGSPAEWIVGAAREAQADLVVVGASARRGPFPSVASRVTRTSPVPVLVVRG